MRQPELPQLDIETAKTLLASAHRGILYSEAFGDSEVWWKIGDTKIAGGYFGSSGASVWFEATTEYSHTTFEEKDATGLEHFGVLTEKQSNNENDRCWIRDSENDPWRIDPRFED